MIRQCIGHSLCPIIYIGMRRRKKKLFIDFVWFYGYIIPISSGNCLTPKESFTNNCAATEQYKYIIAQVVFLMFENLRNFLGLIGTAPTRPMLNCQSARAAVMGCVGILSRTQKLRAIIVTAGCCTVNGQSNYWRHCNALNAF